MQGNFRYQHFVAVCRNLGGRVIVVDDVLSSYEQEIYPTTSPDENCIEFMIQTNWNCQVELRQTYLALKLTFVKGRGWQRSKKGAERSGRFGNEGRARGSNSTRLSCIHYFARVLFQSRSIHQQSANLQLKEWNVHAQILHFQQLQGYISEYKGFLQREGYRFEEFLD